MNKNVIIVAGGSGLRMGAEFPKQFLPIGGKPILMHTMEVFSLYDKNIQIILVISKAHLEYWRQLCLDYNFIIPHKIAYGGETRFYSVLNGLDLIEEKGLTAVHDAVRPFVSLETIDRCFKAASKYNAAIPVLTPIESIRKITADGNIPKDRNNYRLVQTPQVFKTNLLKKAYNNSNNSNATDDASVVGELNHAIALVEGNIENIKITTPFDLIIAEAILADN